MTKLLSNLQIGQKIGSGFFGDVHEAQDEVHGKVAVKIFQQRVGETAAEWKKRKDGLLKEGQHLQQATHRNVVQVLYLVESDVGDGVYLAMRFCEGGSLQGAFDNGPMRLGEVRRLLTDVSFGLQALHTRGMLHRDIKPGNILCDGKNCWMLGDFGFVTDDLILGYGSAAGYSDHLAPEIWSGGGTTEKTDVWALGMTVYRLLHGAEWYNQSPAPQTIVANGGFARKLKWLPHIPDGWRRFVRKMLHDDSASRYQSAAQVTNALSALSETPNFSCKVSGSRVVWIKRAESRIIRVVWNKAGSWQFEWQAWSAPIGGMAGRKHTLGGGSGSRARTSSELEVMFAERLG